MLRRRYFPTVFTALHLLAGCLAITLIFNEHFETATYVLMSACVFDLLDGFFERIFAKVPLAHTRDVHILADIVTYGVAPAMLLFNLVNEHPKEFDSYYGYITLATPFVFVLSTALRLARYQIEDLGQMDWFLGLPAPASALFVCSAALVSKYDEFHLRQYILTPMFISSVSIGLSILQNLDIVLLGFKWESGRKLTAYKSHLIFLLFSLVAIWRLHWAAGLFILPFYIIISIFTAMKATSIQISLTPEAEQAKNKGHRPVEEIEKMEEKQLQEKREEKEEEEETTNSKKRLRKTSQA
jgi:CDP-diacylglycerol--serine O-phosphatidyltransferase